MVYFLKINVAIALFYAFYRLFFYKDTFFTWRRTALLCFFGVSALVPLLDIQTWIAAQEPMVAMADLYGAVLTELTITPQAQTMDWHQVMKGGIELVYWIVAALLSARLFVQLASILRLARQCPTQKVDGILIHWLSPEKGSFSFFRWIFIPQASGSEAGIDDILVHEATHARQWHSLDILLGEAVCILCWFNSFAWGLKREIGINHEYLADEEVVRAGFNKKAYQYHLIGVKHPQLAIANLYNHFSVLPLKRRIKMLNKKRTRSVGKVKYLALLPLAAGLLLVNNIDAMARVVNEKVVAIIQPKPVETVAAPVAVTPDDESQVFTVVEEMPKFPGGQGALLEFLAKNIQYPAEAKQNGTQGRVQICFIVEKDGSLSNVEVLRGIDPALDAEAVRVIKAMPKWEPGKQRGQVVRVKYTVPVTFRLQ